MWEKYLWKLRWFGPWFVFKAAVVGCRKSGDGARVPCSQSLHGLSYCDSDSCLVKPVAAISLTMPIPNLGPMIYASYDMTGLPLTYSWA